MRFLTFGGCLLNLLWLREGLSGPAFSCNSPGTLPSRFNAVSHLGGQGKITALWGLGPALRGQVSDAEHPSLKVVLAVGTRKYFLTGRGHGRILDMNEWPCHPAARGMALSLEAFFLY